MEKETYPIQEVAGQSITAEQYGHLHDWDVYLENTFAQLEADRPLFLAEQERRKKSDEYMKRTIPGIRDL